MIRAAVMQPIECETVKLSVTTSIGVAILDNQGAADWSVTMKQADQALYHSKRNGRNRYTVFNASIGAQQTEKCWLEAEVKHALADKAFTLFYQPRIDLKANKVVGAEALLRWSHPERGFIPPDVFIPVCEEVGIIDDIGVLVFQQACQQMSEWRRQGFEINLSVNVSPKQFQHEGFLAACEEVAATADFPLSSLELEVTESSLVGENDNISRRINRINELGFRLVLDDFGTGFSNLAHISRFPVYCLKLDRSFVHQLPSAGPMLLLVLALAKQIGAKTVAEGVETLEQLAWLQQQDCDQVQGFLFSQAVPADELIQTCWAIASGRQLKGQHSNKHRELVESY